MTLDELEVFPPLLLLSLPADTVTVAVTVTVGTGAQEAADEVDHACPLLLPAPLMTVTMLVGMAVTYVVV